MERIIAIELRGGSNSGWRAKLSCGFRPLATNTQGFSLDGDDLRPNGDHAQEQCD
jgi:hypothetical protein